MKQLFFDIDSESEIQRLVGILREILSLDGMPTPKIILYDVPDMELTQNE